MGSVAPQTDLSGGAVAAPGTTPRTQARHHRRRPQHPGHRLPPADAGGGRRRSGAQLLRRARPPGDRATAHRPAGAHGPEGDGGTDQPSRLSARPGFSEQTLSAAERDAAVRATCRLARARNRAPTDLVASDASSPPSRPDPAGCPRVPRRTGRRVGPAPPRHPHDLDPRPEPPGLQAALTLPGAVAQLACRVLVRDSRGPTWRPGSWSSPTTGASSTIPRSGRWERLVPVCCSTARPTRQIWRRSTGRSPRAKPSGARSPRAPGRPSIRPAPTPWT
jgi:hypothetical protein